MNREELIAAVLAAPDDDAPRLVYADWLQQRGDPRGELIALQCRGDGLDGPGTARELALLDAHREAWAGAIGLAGSRARFRRGFIERAVVASGYDVKQLARFPRLEPIETVRLTLADRLVADDVEQCLALGARRLDLNGRPLGEHRYGGFRTLGFGDGAPNVAQLSGLAVAGCDLEGSGVEELVTTRALRGLAELVVRRNGRGVGEALAVSGLPLLRVLDASFNFLRDGVAAMARSLLRPFTLRLRRAHIDDRGFAELLGSRVMSRMRHLDVAGNDDIRAFADALVASPFASDLEELDVTSCPVSSDEVRRALEGMPALRILAGPKICDALGDLDGRVRPGGAPLPW